MPPEHCTVLFLLVVVPFLLVVVPFLLVVVLSEHCAMLSEHCAMLPEHCAMLPEHCAMLPEHCAMPPEHCAMVWSDRTVLGADQFELRSHPALPVPSLRRFPEKVLPIRGVALRLRSGRGLAERSRSQPYLGRILSWK
jgi:hypothetical protein